MGYDVFGVYLVDFKENFGAEFSEKHYAVVLTKASGDNTLLVAPLTSKSLFIRFLSFCYKLICKFR